MDHLIAFHPKRHKIDPGRSLLVDALLRAQAAARRHFVSVPTRRGPLRALGLAQHLALARGG